MREHLVRLNGEAKMFRRFGDPVLDSRLFYQLAEGVIHFDGIQFRCVEVQKFLLRKFLGIEGGFPCRISPSGSANVEMRHRFVCSPRAAAFRARAGIISCDALPALTSLSSSSSFSAFFFLRAAAPRLGRR